MRTLRTSLPALIAAIAIAFVAVSCSTGPAPPRPGTPAFYWSAAKETYRAGDYLKAQENLGQITKSDNQFTAQARPFEILLTTGIAKGYMELADVYDAGARRNRANPTPFRRQSSALRGMASSAALEGAQVLHQYLTASKDQPVTLDFEFPAGSAVQPPNLQKIAGGMLMQDSEAASVRKAMVQRGVVMAVSSAVGATDDTAKALEIFKTQPAKVDGKTFLMGVAGAMYDLSQLYSPNKLDDPNRLTVMCNEAKEALDLVPASKETKALNTKIEAALKKAKTS